jgi:hypothetical protein
LDYFAEQVRQREQSSGLNIHVVVTNGGDDLGGDVRGWSVAILRSQLGVDWMRLASSDPRHTVVILYTAEAGTGHGSTGVRVGRALNDVGILPPNLSADDGPIRPVVRAAQWPAEAEPALLQVIDNIIAEYKTGHTLRFDRNGVIAESSPAPSVAPSVVASRAPASAVPASVAPATTDDDNSGLGWLWIPILAGIGFVVVMVLRGLAKRGRDSRMATPTVAVARDIGDVTQEHEDAVRRTTAAAAPVHARDQGDEAQDRDAAIRRALAEAEAAQARGRRTETVVAPAPARRVEPVRSSTPARKPEPVRHSSPPPSSRVHTPVRRSSSSGTIVTGAGCTTVISTPVATCSKCNSSNCSSVSSGPSASSCGGGSGSSGGSSCGGGGSSCGSSS